jgi:hypothetical protein
VFLGEGQACLAIGGFGDHVDVVFDVQECAESAA